jgi:amidase
MDIMTNSPFPPDTGPDLYKGAPVCVQVVGYRHADEALANTVTVLDSIINHKGSKKL